MDQRKARLFQRGIDHLRSGNLDAAQASFESLLAAEPGNEAARYRLSLIAVRRGRFRQALALAESLIDAQARPELMVHVARCHLALGNVAPAVDLLDRALAAGPRSAVVLATLAIALGQLGRHAHSLEVFDRAIAIEPREPTLYYNRALVRRELGQIDAAAEDLEACLARQAGHAQAHWALASLRTCDAGFQHVERLQRLLARLPAGSPGEEALVLSLFKELDDLGRPAEAMPLLKRALALRPASRVSAVDRRRWFQSLRGLAPGGVPGGQASERALVFVVGMPRAGVELLARCLARHPSVWRPPLPCGLLPYLARAAGMDAGAALDTELRDRIAALDPAAAASGFLAAQPSPTVAGGVALFAQSLDYQLVGVIAKYFPGARILHAVRDPADTCLSLLAQPHGQAPASVSQPPVELPEDLGEYYREYADLMRHWHTVFPGRILDVPFESLLGKPEMLLRVIGAFIGLRYDPAMRAALAPSTRPVGHWRQYLPGLGQAADWPRGAGR